MTERLDTLVEHCPHDWESTVISCPCCYPNDAGKLCVDCGFYYCSHCGTFVSLEEFVDMCMRLRREYAKYLVEEDAHIARVRSRCLTT